MSLKKRITPELKRALQTVAYFKHKCPDSFVHFGMVTDSVELRRPGEEETVNVEELRALATPALFGKGEKTLFDEDIRRASVLSNEHVRVHWSQMSTVLLNVQSELMWWLPKSHLYLDAKFYQIVYYEEGSKFKVHRDSRRPFRDEYDASQHVLTLIVDVTPPYKDRTDPVRDVTFFRDRCPASFGGKAWQGYDRSFAKTRIHWQSHRGDERQWGAWFTSVFHEVEPMYSSTNRHRVVAAFDVYLRKMPVPIVAAEQEQEAVPMCANKLDSFVWQLIASYMGSDAANLRRCSQYFRHHITSTVLLAAILRSPVDTIRRYARKSRHVSMATLLYHTYSVAPSTIEKPGNVSLYGCDRMFVDALLTLGYSVGVTRTVATREQRNAEYFAQMRGGDEETGDQPEIVNVGRKILQDKQICDFVGDVLYDAKFYNLWGDVDYTVMELPGIAIPDNVTLPPKLRDFLQYEKNITLQTLFACTVQTERELDDDLGLLLWPWKAQLLAETMKTLDARTDHDWFLGAENLWGNAAIFDVLCYHKSLLVVDLGTNRCRCKCRCLFEEVHCRCECGAHDRLPMSLEIGEGLYYSSD